MPGNIRFNRIITRTSGVVYELQRLHFSRFRPPAEAWRPQINAYCYEDRLEVCIDLAGVDRANVEIHVEARKLLVRGTRPSPEPVGGDPDSPCRQILAMEIENGPFERIFSLPTEVNVDAVTARQEKGLLWIQLPVRS
jgi:HSP20 family molecular chaperone IbpA